MKMLNLAWIGALSTLMLTTAHAQQLTQPLSVRPIGFNYNNFYQGEVATPVIGSPVEAVVPAPTMTSPAMMQQAPALAAETPACSECMAPVQSPAQAPIAAPSTPSACGCTAAAPSCGAAGCGGGCEPLQPAYGAPAACTTLSPAPACDGCGGGCGGGCGASACGACGGSSCLGGGCLSGLCGGCDLGDAWTLSGALHGDCPPCIDVGGWFSSGYHSESNDLFNSRPDELALHQGWLYFSKAATSDSPLGFRADIMYGIDADDTQAFGNDPGNWDFDNGLDYGAYGWAFPQLYAELALGEWTITAGHFYTLVGYEVVTAPDNFFYSHSMTMYNSEPFTHTGAMASRTFNDSLTIYAGWTLGWDTGFDEVNDGSSWLGGFSLDLTDSASFTYISTAGNLGARGDEAYSHSLVLDMGLTEKLNWVVQSDLLRVTSTGEDNLGINQYFLYSLSDCLGLGARVEWWKADNITGYAPHGAVLPADGSFSYYAATFGANYRPHANVVIRPEVRIDWSPAADYDESYVGVDSVFTF